MIIAGMRLENDSSNSEDDSLESDSDSEDLGEEFEEAILDKSEKQEEQVSEERNWWDSESNSD